MGCLLTSEKEERDELSRELGAKQAEELATDGLRLRFVVNADDPTAITLGLWKSKKLSDTIYWSYDGWDNAKCCKRYVSPRAALVLHSETQQINSVAGCLLDFRPTQGSGEAGEDSGVGLDPGQRGRQDSALCGAS